MAHQGVWNLRGEQCACYPECCFTEGFLRIAWTGHVIFFMVMWLFSFHLLMWFTHFHLLSFSLSSETNQHGQDICVSSLAKFHLQRFRSVCLSVVLLSFSYIALAVSLPYPGLTETRLFLPPECWDLRHVLCQDFFLHQFWGSITAWNVSFYCLPGLSL